MSSIQDVLFVHSRLCARTAKEAKALQAEGVRVHLIEVATPSPFYDYAAFTSHTHLDHPHDVRSLLTRGRSIRRDLRRAVRAVPHDIVHTHNAPDCIGAWVREATTAPLLHDIHDAQTVLPTLYSNPLANRFLDLIKRRWERQAVGASDALVVPSPRMARHYADKYGLPDVHAFENKVEPVTFTPKPKLSKTQGGIHVSYAGGLSFVPGAVRNLWPVFEELAGGDIHVHVYSINFDDREQERLRAACERLEQVHYHEPLGGPAYFAEMSQYDYGLIWFMSFNPNLEFATANRMYELPVVGSAVITNMQTGYIGEWVRSGRRGIVANNIAEVKTQLANAPQFDLDPSACFMDGARLAAIYAEVRAARDASART